MGICQNTSMPADALPYMMRSEGRTQGLSQLRLGIPAVGKSLNLAPENCNFAFDMKQGFPLVLEAKNPVRDFPCYFLSQIKSLSGPYSVNFEL